MGVRQPCCRCVGKSISNRPQSPHHLFQGLFLQKGDNRTEGNEKIVVEFIRRDINERQIASLTYVGMPTKHVSRIVEVLGGFDFAVSGLPGDGVWEAFYSRRCRCCLVENLA
jgi:hypothetical protein